MSQENQKHHTTLSNEEVIFSSIFSVDDGVNSRKQELVTVFSSPEMFKNEFYVFFILTKDMPKIYPNKEFMALYLQTNRAIYLKSKSIDFTQYQVGDADPYIEFTNSCITIFEECFKRKVSDEEYYRALEMHKMEYINRESVSILEESAQILSEGVTYRGKSYSGYEDMRNVSKNRFLKLDNMMKRTDRKGIVTYSMTDEEDDEETRVKLVTKFGVEALDKALGGIYEGDMVSLLAPPKGCKSRFATYVLHNALINGVSCVEWSVENGFKGWEYLLRARHFNWFYNSNQTDVTQKKIIDSDMIRKGEMSEEMKALELASWADLRCNPAYGRISNVDEDFSEDTFLEILEAAVDKVGAKFICVDYLQLLGGDTPKVDRIGEAYKKVLQFLKKRRIAGIFPGQLKQSVLGDIQRVKAEDLINMELRDSAGESHEVIRTPDVNLALYGTVEDIRNGYMRLLSIPSRNSSPFEPIDLYVDAGTCTFSSHTKVS